MENESRDRDSKGRFVKGVTPKGARPISEGVAKEYQARSAAKRKENRTIRETMLAALMEDGGGGFTRLEHIVRKALDNHRKGKLSFRDLRDLAAILGEETLNVKTDGPSIVVVPEGSMDALEKWARKDEEQ